MNKTHNPHERQSYWQAQINEWQASGLSGAQFCQQNNLSYHRFVYWRQKFCTPKRVPSSPDQDRGFVPVTLTPAMDSELSLTLPSGLVIRGITASSIATVKHLLAAL